MTTQRQDNRRRGDRPVRRGQRHQPLLRDPRGGAADGPAARRGSGRARCSGRSFPRWPSATRSSSSTCRGTAAPPTSTGRSIIRLMADDIAALIDHLGLDKPDLVGYSLGGWVALPHGGEVPGQGRPAGGGLGQHPARRDLSGDARPAGPGERGRGRVHDRHPDVPALPAGARHAPRTSPAAGQDRRGDGQGLRLHRGGPRPPGADADRRRRRRHGAAEPRTSRSSSCSTAASGTAAGWARAGPRAVTRWRSCPA